MSDTPIEANNRQRNFFNKLREGGSVWTLQSDGGYANFQEEESTVIPVWVDEEDARNCTQEHFKDYQPQSIPVDVFWEEIVPLLIQNEVWMAINPTSDLCGNQVSAAEFEELFLLEEA
jgi:hypothetical protein